MDVSVTMLRQVPAGLRRVCGGASASVRPTEWWFSSCFTETSTHSTKLCRCPPRFFRCSSRIWLGHACCCSTTGCVWIQTVQKTVEVPQVQYFDRVVDVPAAVHRQGLDVSMILQSAGALSHSEVPQIAVHRMSWVYDGNGQGFWAHFAPFFALLRFSGVERQVSVEEPSTTKSSSSSRAGGVALTPGVSPRCQATSCA